LTESSGEIIPKNRPDRIQELEQKLQSLKEEKESLIDI
jgi:hypothetical protein